MALVLQLGLCASCLDAAAVHERRHLTQPVLAGRDHLYEPFQGEKIGVFTVLAPLEARYLQLIANSETRPKENTRAASKGLLGALQVAAADVVRYAKAAWGQGSLKQADERGECDQLRAVRHPVR